MANEHAENMPEETSIHQMRERIDQLNAENQTLKGSISELNSVNRSLQAKDHFRDAGVSPKYADLFVKVHEGEITSDAVKGFVDEYALGAQTAVAGSGVEAAMPRVQDSSLSQFGQSASIPGIAGASSTGEQEQITVEDWRKLKESDPVQADLLARSGGVQLRDDNPYASELAKQAAIQHR